MIYQDYEGSHHGIGGFALNKTTLVTTKEDVVNNYLVLHSTPQGTSISNEDTSFVDLKFTVLYLNPEEAVCNGAL